MTSLRPIRRVRAGRRTGLVRPRLWELRAHGRGRCLGPRPLRHSALRGHRHRQAAGAGAAHVPSASQRPHAHAQQITATIVTGEPDRKTRGQPACGEGGDNLIRLRRRNINPSFQTGTDGWSNERCDDGDGMPRPRPARPRGAAEEQQPATTTSRQEPGDHPAPARPDNHGEDYSLTRRATPRGRRATRSAFYGVLPPGRWTCGLRSFPVDQSRFRAYSRLARKTHMQRAGHDRPRGLADPVCAVSRSSAPASRRSIHLHAPQRLHDIHSRRPGRGHQRGEDGGAGEERARSNEGQRTGQRQAPKMGRGDRRHHIPARRAGANPAATMRAPSSTRPRMGRGVEPIAVAP